MELIFMILLGGTMLALGARKRPRGRGSLVGWSTSPAQPIDFGLDLNRERDKLTATTGKYEHYYDRDFEMELLEQELLDTRRKLILAEARQPVRIATAEPPSQVIGDSDTFRPIHFKPDEPQRFDQFEGQKQVILPLQKAVEGLAPSTRRVIDHRLLTGLPGLGKTLIAKVLGNELDLRARRLGLPPVPFFWTFAANLTSTEDYDNVVRQLLMSKGGVWFIDEIHVLNREQGTKIYSLMEDGVYPFHGELQPTPVPDVVVVGATTDYGALHAAVKRRFGEPLMVRPMSSAELLGIVLKRSFPIDRDAAELLVSRTHWSGAPWEALVLRREAEVYARAARRTVITVIDVRDVFETYEIDEIQGLRWIDREALRVLFQRPRFRGKSQEFVCYAASEGDLCAVAGIHPEEYRETIKPRLMSRCLIEVRSGYGQALTPTAIDLYGHLKRS